MQKRTVAIGPEATVQGATLMILRTSYFAFIVTVLITMSGCPYHKPPFMGKVIDAETKEPIEGAVAVVVYNKTAMGVGAGNVSYAMDVRESLSDKEGMFRVPSYTTVVLPFTWETTATFIIYRPGYDVFPDYRSDRPSCSLSLSDQELFFSDKVGTEKEFRVYIGGEYEMMNLRTGIVELSKANTWEERNRATMISPTDDKSQWPILNRMIRNEDEWLSKNRGWRR
jgi:hypothetical protein